MLNKLLVNSKLNLILTNKYNLVIIINNKIYKLSPLN